MLEIIELEYSPPKTSIFNSDGSWNDAGKWDDTEVYIFL